MTLISNTVNHYGKQTKLVNKKGKNQIQGQAALKTPAQFQCFFVKNIALKFLVTDRDYISL